MFIPKPDAEKVLIETINDMYDNNYNYKNICMKHTILIHVREPILPLAGSITHRVNNFIRFYDSLIGGKKILILPKNQRSLNIFQNYTNVILYKSKYEIKRVESSN